ncbi:MAG: hypothetical protein C0591_03210, partial [Marinilabiliales bacterium]
MKGLMMTEMKKQIGKRVQQARQQAGLQQVDLAVHLHLTVSAIGQKERGASFFNPAELARLATLLVVSVEYLVTGKPSGEQVANGATAEESRLLQGFRMLS